jgi:hypothetical protein
LIVKGLILAYMFYGLCLSVKANEA